MKNTGFAGLVATTGLIVGLAVLTTSLSAGERAELLDLETMSGLLGGNTVPDLPCSHTEGGNVPCVCEGQTAHGCIPVGNSPGECSRLELNSYTMCVGSGNKRLACTAVTQNTQCGAIVYGTRIENGQCAEGGCNGGRIPCGPQVSTTTVKGCNDK